MSACNRIWNYILGLSLLALAQVSAAQTILPATFTVEGRLYNAQGEPWTSTSAVTFQLEVVADGCVIYQETQSNVTVSSTDPTATGVFALPLGMGTPATNASYSGQLFLPGFHPGFDSCTAGVTTAAGDTRLVRVKVSQDGGNTYETLSPDTLITATATATVADSLQGYTPASFILSNTNTALVQSNVETVFTNSNYTALLALLSGQSTQYLPLNPTTTVSLNGQTLTNIAAPTSTSAAVNKGYADSNLYGKSLNLSNLANGQTLVWNATASDWIAQNLGVTYVGSGTGLIGGNFSSAGTLSVDVGVAANKILQLTPAAQIPAVDGSLLFNVSASRLIGFNVSTTTPTAGQVLIWNATLAQWSAANTGAITALTGDVVATGPGSAGATIQSGAVNLASKIISTYGGPGQLLITDATGNYLTYGTCAIAGQVYQWTTQGWACASVNALLGNNSVTAGTYGAQDFIPQITVDATGRVTSLSNVNVPVLSVAGKTGAVELTAADISGLGSAATQAYGAAAGELVQLDSRGLIPTALMTNLNLIGKPISTVTPNAAQVLTYNSSLGVWDAESIPVPSTGTVTNVGSGAGLLGGPIATSGTLSVDVGTAANKILQITSAGIYPADDGSLISNINALRLASNSVSTKIPAANQVLTWNATDTAWEPSSPALLSVTNVTSGTGLVANTITGMGTLNVDVGTAANKILQVTVTGVYPADDGSLISNLNATRVGTRKISTNAPNPGQALIWNSTNTDWEPSNTSTGTVTSIVSGGGLVAGTLSAVGTLSVDVGTAANKILQVTAAGLYPADDGSLITNINPSTLGGKPLSLATATAAQVLTFNGTTSKWDAENPINSNVFLNGGNTFGLAANLGTNDNNNLYLKTNGNAAMTVLTNGYVGIGTTLPTARLTVAYQLGDSQATAYFGSNYSGNNQNAVVAATNSGNGVTASSNGGYGVQGISSSSAGVYGSSNSNYGVWGQSTSSVSGYFSSISASNTQPTLVAQQYAGSPADLQQWLSSSATVLAKITASGNLGVGTASPQGLLDVYGLGNQSAMIVPRDSTANRPTASVNGMIRYASDTGKFEGYQNGAWQYFISSTNGTVTSIVSGTGLVANTISSTGTLSVDVGTAANKILRVTASGIYPPDDGSLISNVNAALIEGYALAAVTPTAGQLLTFNSTTNLWQPQTGLYLPLAGGTMSGPINLAGNQVTSTGNIGIGTSAPNYQLHVQQADSSPEIGIINTTSTVARYPNVSIYNYDGSVSTAGYPTLSLYNARGNSSTPSALQAGDIIGSVQAYGGNGVAFAGGTNASAAMVFLANENFSGSDQSSNIAFYTTTGTTYSEKMRITTSGNVGIGTPNPQSTLDVVGSENLAGNLNAKMNVVAQHFLGGTPNASISNTYLSWNSSASLTNENVSGTDVAQTIQFQVLNNDLGINIPIVTVTFSQPFASPPVCIFSPGSLTSANFVSAGYSPYIATTPNSYSLYTSGNGYPKSLSTSAPNNIFYVHCFQ